MTALVDVQLAYEASNETEQAIADAIPSAEQLQIWADCVLSTQHIDEGELTVRFVGEAESQELNHQYRDRNKPTNVLSFPFECPPGIELNLLGDLVICAPVIAREALEQSKPTPHHYAHMVVHGMLHLLGFDHIEQDEAEEMEALEIQILSQLDIDDPYQEH
ncbi:rRNA maturation RNase YbeY [Alteromonas aestuariivivens]|uniref:Endoribonuclease YbeY n=1 Tax=Alteromonas aestuariivivens TaxID=1938339 RepID=A0A3D8M5Y5_9ALTE|nr:rRNA maturation RNase YbeY [Alteromonas aestuariivivens]RDV24572.1 rRNA maturation RNase YbeY [Alteromonas aestuariivivens]